MSAFATSTHALHWIFSPAALAMEYEQRSAASAALAAAVDSPSAVPEEPAKGEEPTGAGKKRARPAEEEEGGSQKRSRHSGAGAAAAAQSEQDFLDWCCLALLRMCRVSHLDRAITGTALVYLRRYYIKGLFYHYPPHEMM